MSIDKVKPELPIIDHRPARYSGPPKEEVLALRQQYISPGVITYYKEPMMIVEGHMQYVYDEKGPRYLDAFAGIVTVSVGHCHPQVVERVQEQVGKLQHTTTIYLHPDIGEFGKRLAEKHAGTVWIRAISPTPAAKPMKWPSCRRESITGNSDVIALRNGYHGGTSIPMSLTAHGTWKFKTNNRANIHHTHAGLLLSLSLQPEYPSCDLKCAHDIKDVIEYQTPGEVACFIGEPIQGVAAR